MLERAEIRRECESRTVENECPSCGKIVAFYPPGPRGEHEITRRVCVECRCKPYQDSRPMEMSHQEAMDTYDENQERARRYRERDEGRD